MTTDRSALEAARTMTPQRAKEIADTMSANGQVNVVAFARAVEDECRAALSPPPAPVLRATKISIPTETMEQEFQVHYRRGYEAGKASAPALDDARDALEVMAALSSGEWRLNRHLPWSALTDEANSERAWSVERQAAPFCDAAENRVWFGSTAIAALQSARAALQQEPRS